MALATRGQRTDLIAADGGSAGVEGQAADFERRTLSRTRAERLTSSIE